MLPRAFLMSPMAMDWSLIEAVMCKASAVDLYKVRDLGFLQEMLQPQSQSNSCSNSSTLTTPSALRSRGQKGTRSRSSTQPVFDSSSRCACVILLAYAK